MDRDDPEEYDEFSEFHFPDNMEDVRMQEIYRKQAKEVFDEMVHGLPDFLEFGEDDEVSIKIFRDYTERLNGLIDRNLNSDTIWAFAIYCGDLRESVLGKLRAQKRLKDDPKQAAKAEVKDCWELWQADPNRYKSKAAFARDMMNKFDELENQRVIERWCKEWETPSP